MIRRENPIRRHLFVFRVVIMPSYKCVIIDCISLWQQYRYDISPECKSFSKNLLGHACLSHTHTVQVRKVTRTAWKWKEPTAVFTTKPAFLPAHNAAKSTFKIVPPPFSDRLLFSWPWHTKNARFKFSIFRVTNFAVNLFSNNNNITNNKPSYSSLGKKKRRDYLENVITHFSPSEECGEGGGKRRESQRLNKQFFSARNQDIFDNTVVCCRFVCWKHGALVVMCVLLSLPPPPPPTRPFCILINPTSPSTHIFSVYDGYVRAGKAIYIYQRYSMVKYNVM